MTFVKPSTITNQTGAYAYKRGVSSPSFNYIDNNFPNMLDKTGDFVTGTVTFNSGSLLVMESGSLLDIGSGISFANSSYIYGNLTFYATDTNPSITQLTMIADVATNTLTLQSQSAYASAATNVNGGGFVIATGNAAAGGNAGTLTLQLGNGIGAENVLVATPTNTSLYVGGTHLAAFTTSTVELFEPVTFANTVVFPGISQNSTGVASATGQPMYVKAQQATGTTSKGGDVVLWSGAGTSAYGQIYMAPGGYAVAQFGQFQGTINTQAQINQTFMAVASTTASGSNVQLATIPIIDDAAVFVEVQWIRRGLTGSGALGNRMAFVGICNGSGTVTINTPTAAYSGSAFDAATNLSVTTGTNLITITAVAQSVADDWEAVINVVNA